MREDLNVRLKRQSKKTFLSKVCAKFGFVFVLAVFIIALTFTGILGENRSLRLEPSSPREFILLDDLRTEREDAVELAHQAMESRLRANNFSVWPRSIPNDQWDLYVLYKNKQGSSLFDSEEKINLMKKIEENIRFYSDNETSYWNFCLSARNSTDCSSTAILSLLNYFQNTSTPEEINKTLNLLAKPSSLETFSGFHLDKGFQENSTNCAQLRTRFRFGGPLALPNLTFNGTYDRREFQNDLFNKFLKRVTDKILSLNESNTGKIEVKLFSESMMRREFIDQTKFDFRLLAVLLSLIFVGSMIHARSVLTGFFTALHIGEVIAFSLYIYKEALEGTKMQTLNLWAIVVSVAVCYFNVAILTNISRRANIYLYFRGEPEKKIAWTLHQGVWRTLAMTVVTLTAFLVTRFVPLVSVMSFGVVGTIFVVTNFVLGVVSFVPLLQISDKLEAMVLERFCPSTASNTFDSAGKEENANEVPMVALSEERRDQDQKIALDTTNNRLDLTKEEGAPTLGVMKSEIDNNNHSRTAFQSNNVRSTNNFVYFEDRVLTRVERYFSKSHLSCLSFLGMFIVMALLILLGFTIFGAFQYEYVQRPEELLRTENRLISLQDEVFSKETFRPNDDEELIVTDLVWGIKSREGMGQKNFWDVNDLGQVIWDDGFYAEFFNSQNFLYDVCERIKRNFIVRNQKIVCFMSDFKDYLTTNFLGFPAPYADFMQRIGEFINNTDIGNAHLKQNNIGVDWVAGKIKFIKMSALSRVRRNTGRDSLIAHYNYWENLTATERARAPDDVKNFFPTSGEVWQWWFLQEPLVLAAGKGYGISLLVVFVVVILITGNFFMSLFTIITVVAQSTAFLSVIYLMGWEFGVSETIATLLVVGLSAQDVLLFSFEYCKSLEIHRLEKVRVTLKDWGPTILGNNLIIFIGYIVFIGSKNMQFYKLSIFFATFTSFTLFWTLVFLPAVCVLIGPQLDEWNLYRICFKASPKGKTV